MQRLWSKCHRYGAYLYLDGHFYECEDAFAASIVVDNLGKNIFSHQNEKMFYEVSNMLLSYIHRCKLRMKISFLCLNGLILYEQVGVNFGKMVVDKLHRSGSFSCQFLPCRCSVKDCRNYSEESFSMVGVEKLAIGSEIIVCSLKKSMLSNRIRQPRRCHLWRGGVQGTGGEGARTGGCGPLLHSINQAILPPTISAYNNDNEEDDNKDNGIDNRDKCWKQRQVYQSGNTTTSA